MARRAHRPSHALFTRPCGSCASVFDYCGGCQPGRCYCGEACSGAVREGSIRQAQAKYNDRGSDEGREIHRVEEADRRGRRAAERVGDHRCREVASALQVPPSAAACAATQEASNATPELCVERPGGAPPSTAPSEWVLVAWPEVLTAARLRLGTEAECPFCGRRGRIVRVIPLDEWRRRIRRGLR